MNPTEISKMKKFLIANSALKPNGEDFKDLAVLIEKLYEYLKIGNDTQRKLEPKIISWWLA